MNLRAILSLACCGLVAACSQTSASAPTIVVDGWWDHDYASQFETVCGLGQCVPGASIAADAYESAVITEVAAHPACHGVRIWRTSGPADFGSPELAKIMRREHWTFMIDYNPHVPDDAQHWTLQPSKNEANVLVGNGSPAKIAAAICAIALGRGGAAG